MKQNRIVAPKTQPSMLDHVKVKKSIGTGDFTFEKSDNGGKKELEKACMEKGVIPVIRKSIVSTNATTKSRAVKNPEVTKNQKKARNTTESTGDQVLGKFGFGKVSEDELSNNSSILKRAARASKKRTINEISEKSPPK